MRFFEAHAPALAVAAVEGLELGAERQRITHVLVTCCTGLSSPGIDLELIDRCGLPNSVERSVIGFMGCYAAINALKLAHHIVRSDKDARVLAVNLELCTVHLKDTTDLEQILSFLLWGDRCAASLVTADPVGVALDSFKAVVARETRDLMTWNIRDLGFDMLLSGQVPAAIHHALTGHVSSILGGAPAELDRPLGGASRRPLGARRSGTGACACARRACRFARGAPAIRQHVLGDGDVRA